MLNLSKVKKKHFFIWLCISFFIISLSQLLYPQIFFWSDEAGYVSTAYRILDQWKILSSGHTPVDIMTYGTNHTPVHAPVYMLFLAFILTIFEHQSTPLLFNQIIYATTLFNFFLFVRAEKLSIYSLFSLAILLTLPLGFGYANTAMMESFVLFIGSLIVLNYFSMTLDSKKIYLFYILAVIAWFTRQSLIFLIAAIIIVDFKGFILHHMKILTEKKKIINFLLTIVSLILIISHYYSLNHGKYPNFISGLDGLSFFDKIQSIVLRFQMNIKYFMVWKEFPHDYYYSYTLFCFALSFFSTLFSRNLRCFRFNLSAFIFFSISVLALLALYDNFDWRSHRVFMINCLMSVVSFVLYINELKIKKNIHKLFLVLTLSINVFGAYKYSEFLYKIRIQDNEKLKKKDTLTSLGLVKHGDLVFYHHGFEFLARNPKTQIMWIVPHNLNYLRSLILKAKPHFIVLKYYYDLSALNYDTISHKDGEYIYRRIRS